MEAYKKAALQLHGFGDSDRQWLLENLKEHQRRQLLPMLDELEALGIPKQPNLVEDIGDAIGADVPDEMVAPPAAEPPKHVQPLLAADPEAIYTVLKAEAPETIAAVLLSYSWPWHLPVLASFEDSSRKSISQAMAQIKDKLTLCVSEAIVRAVTRQLNQPAEPPPLDDETEPASLPPVRWWSIFRRWSWQR